MQTDRKKEIEDNQVKEEQQLVFDHRARFHFTVTAAAKRVLRDLSCTRQEVLEILPS